MSDSSDLLVEIGTEELPPTALRRMRDAFTASLDRLLDEHHLPHGVVRGFATPRRLAVRIEAVPASQPDREVTRRGPALKAAFDAEGRPTRPALGFAASCGVEVEALQRLETDKGAWLAWHSTEAGRSASAVIPELVEQALKSLPTPKRMRWGDADTEFVRPVHWVLLLLGDQALGAHILGRESGRETRGHRFHHPQAIPVPSASAYEQLLETEGQVIADLEQRRARIRAQVVAAGDSLGGIAVIDTDLLDEVTALVEWPVALTGSFEKRFLEVPSEALVSSMQDHQKFFPVVDSKGALMPHFVTVANIESRDPETVRSGNERVIRPRLEDAAFFWDQDRKRPLAARREQLAGMTFQQQLGSLADKQARVAELAATIAGLLGADERLARRAAELGKCDLVTSMVFEFPELQGIMGRYYALHDGEDPAVADALDEQYQPRHAGDELPATPTGQCLALAERLDTLTGIFAIGQAPSGDKDPFALRRAALGVMRILIECRLDLDLRVLLDHAAALYPAAVNAAAVSSELFEFMLERLRNRYLDAGYDTLVFDAVLARRPPRPLDFDSRMRAVRSFQQLPEAASLAAANKRISNILRKAQVRIPEHFDTALLTEPAEQALAETIGAQQQAVQPLFRKRAYAEALTRLAALQAPVDRFFDDVMVMADDADLRNNRLALLNSLAELFLQVADISRLQQ